MKTSDDASTPTLEYRTPEPNPRRMLRDDVAYVLPMATFLVFIWIAGHWPSLYVPIYAVKTAVVGIMLIALWRYYTPPRWNAWGLGIAGGVIGIVQWVAMQLWLQEHFAMFRPSPEVFDPVKQYGEGTVAFWAFVGVRMVGAVIVVPFMEELFWRDFLWRSIIAPNDFKLSRVGEWDWRAYLLVAIFFATVHGNWWLTAIVWGLMIGGLLAWTRSLGACVIMHAVTNLLLGAYVLYSRDWSFW